MSNNSGTSNVKIVDEQKDQENLKEKGQNKEIIEKDFVPHFLPTYRIKTMLFPVPIIIAIIFAGVLSYITYSVAGVQVDGGYFPEGEYGAIGGILNGLIFTAIAVVSAFGIIFLIRKLGLNILKYIFGLSFGFLGFTISLLFGQVINFLIFVQFPESASVVSLYTYINDIVLPVFLGILTIFLIFKYFTSKSIKTKNFIVLYIGLLTSAALSILMPLWTTLAILIGISIWDIFAVLSKKGPIKEMIDLASNNSEEDNFTKEEIIRKVESGEAIYDTSKLEIGIGDLVFYSMLTSSALIQTNNLIIMILTSFAIIFGTGITILGLKRNKILPGLPISIFLGIGTMILSWLIISILFM